MSHVGLRSERLARRTKQSVEYKSSVLTWLNVGNEGYNHCPVCRFLNGSRTKEDLLATIKALDIVLADCETAT